MSVFNGKHVLNNSEEKAHQSTWQFVYFPLLKPMEQFVQKKKEK